MNSADRENLKKYILTQPDLSFKKTDTGVEGGPCASYVSTLITNGTKKSIINAASILGRKIDPTNRSIQNIESLSDLIRYAIIGDILCVYNAATNDITHYVVYAGNIVDNYAFLTLGVNGFFKNTAFPYKGIVGFNLTPDLWSDGFFLYDTVQRFHKIARIEYDLINSDSGMFCPFCG